MGSRADTIARLAGKSYAYVQHGMDRVIAFGFAAMRQAGEDTAAPAKSRGIASRVGQAGRGLLGFLGTMGDTYFRTYEELKHRRTDDA